MAAIMIKLKSSFDLVPEMVFITWLFLSLNLSLRVSGTTLSAFRRPLISSVIPVRAAINRDARYGAWPNATQVLYRLDTSYSAAEQSAIQLAMAQIASDMNSCIQFQPYIAGTNTGSDHIFIGKTLNSGQAIPTCFSFPGRVLTQAGQGQKMAIFGTSSTNGCLDSQREVMKYLVNVLGVRNEYNRPDRDQYIQVFAANVRPELQSLNLLKVYTAAQVDYLNTAFDFNSITIPSPTKYAISGTVLFTPAAGGQSFGALPRLSQGDCVGLALLYTGCTSTACTDPYGTTTTSTSTSTSTTTT